MYLALTKFRRLEFDKRGRSIFTWVWQTCLTHVYLSLPNMSDPLYFGHDWLPSPGGLGLANMSDPRLLWTWLVATSIHSGLGVLSLENRPNPRLLRFGNMLNPRYLNLINMLGPRYFELCWLSGPCTLDVVGVKSRHLESDKHIWSTFTWVW
jgi:hypothetical protein